MWSSTFFFNWSSSAARFKCVWAFWIVPFRRREKCDLLACGVCDDSVKLDTAVRSLIYWLLAYMMIHANCTLLFWFPFSLSLRRKRHLSSHMLSSTSTAKSFLLMTWFFQQPLWALFVVWHVYIKVSTTTAAYLPVNVTSLMSSSETSTTLNFLRCIRTWCVFSVALLVKYLLHSWHEIFTPYRQSDLQHLCSGCT